MSALLSFFSSLIIILDAKYEKVKLTIGIIVVVVVVVVIVAASAVIIIIIIIIIII
jgi:hypothetical protein